MALINDPRLFSGGSVIFDQRPHIALYAQLAARKQAKEEAFDDYLRNLNKNINSAGLRNQERPIFEKRLAEWQKFGMENRDKLKNPRLDKGAAELQFQRGYQELIDTVAESKLEEEKKKPLVDILTDPTKRRRLGEDVIPEIASHDQPIWIEDKNGNIVRNEQRKSFDPTKLNFKPNFDQGKFFQGLDDVKPSDTKEERVKNPKDLTETVTTTSNFTQKDKDIIASRAVGEYMNNPDFEDTINALNPADYNEFYKQNFGHDIQSKGDLAAAFALKGKQQQVVTQKIENDTYERQKALKALDYAYDKALVSFKDGVDAQNNAWIADDVIAKIKASLKPENRVAYKDETGKWQEGYNIPNTTEYRKAFSVTVGGKVVEPDAIRFNPEDASITPVFWKYKKNADDTYEPVREGPGKGIEVIDYPLTNKHSFSDAVVTLGGKAGMKQKNIEGSTIYGKPPTPGKRTSAYIYKGKKYTPEQIEKAAKQNNMTVDQYIKAAGIE